MNFNFHIENIYNLLVENKLNEKTTNASVLTGSLGKLVFLSAYDSYNPLFSHNDLINEVVSKEINIINSTKISNHSLDGLVGFAHGMSYLFNKKIITVIDENEFFSEIDPFLLELSNEYLSKNEFDPFYGFIGVANLMLERVKKNTEFIPILNKQIEYIISYYQPIIQKKHKGEIDFSISHGVSAMIRFVANYAELTHQIDYYSDFIKQLCLFIISYSENNRLLDFIDEQQSIKRIAPLRWCRGDLSISYIIAKSAMLVEDQFIFSEAKKTIDILSAFRNLEEQELYSATICHGTLGVAHVFSKIEEIYDSPMVREAKNYWYSESLSILNQKNEYMYVDHNGKKVELDGILNGKEGIGLSLLAYLSKDDFPLNTFLQLN